MERGLDAVMFIGIVCIALLFFTFFAEKWFDKEIEKRKQRAKNTRILYKHSKDEKIS